MHPSQCALKCALVKPLSPQYPPLRFLNVDPQGDLMVRLHNEISPNKQELQREKAQLFFVVYQNMDLLQICLTSVLEIWRE